MLFPFWSFFYSVCRENEGGAWIATDKKWHLYVRLFLSVASSAVFPFLIVCLESFQPAPISRVLLPNQRTVPGYELILFTIFANVINVTDRKSVRSNMSGTQKEVPGTRSQGGTCAVDGWIEINCIENLCKTQLNFYNERNVMQLVHTCTNYSTTRYKTERSCCIETTDSSHFNISCCCDVNVGFCNACHNIRSKFLCWTTARLYPYTVYYTLIVDFNAI